MTEQTVNRKSGIKWKVKCMLGGTMLSHNYYLFLLVHTLFLVFTRIPAIFINTLLMNQTGDVNSTLFYNGAIFAACALTMSVSAQIMHKTGCRVTATVGIIGYNILYLCYILFQPYVGTCYMLFGLFNGMADGFYYISYGHMILDYTDVTNRDSGMGIISTLSAGVNLTVPFLAGSILSAIGGVKGYVAIFILAFAIAFLAMAAVFKLPGEVKKEKRNVRYGAFIRLLGENRQILYGLLGETVKGVREGTFMFILNIILYQLIKSEFLIGCNSLLTGLVSILSFWFMSHTFRPDNRRRFMLLAVTGLTGITMICYWFLNPVMVILFAAVNAFLAGMIEISCYTTFFDVSQSVKEIEDFSPELLAFHEIFVVTGRCIGLGAFAFINTVSGAALKAQIFSLLLLTLAQFGTVFMCRTAVRAAARFKMSVKIY